ncbi:MAG: carboxypeptidase-like regulatory domain-containing protein [Bacteroidales bacterium]|nr:carboxypeptidase-like regulatory domain-containing protein [Bacteroidales bacterium]
MIRFFKTVWLLLLLIPFKLVSQEVTSDSVFFSGIVYESDSMKPLVAAHYIVKNKGGITDQQGHFYFHANTGDTVRFSYVGYKTVMFVVTDTLPSLEYLVGIRMTRDTIKIKEVVIYPRIIGDIKMAMTNTQVESQQSQNAMNNMKLAAYQGLTSQPVWDADQHTKNAIDQQNYRNMNRGMIQPDQMVNFTAVIPLAYFAIKKLAGKEKEVRKITVEEEYKIKSMLFKDVNVE